MRRTLKKLVRGNFKKKSRRKTRQIPRKRTRKKRGGAGGEVETPDCFTCPITHAVMDDPVIDPEGNTYERTEIENWLEGNATSPITRGLLAIGDLVPNRALKDAIETWNAAGKPAMVPEPEPEPEPEPGPADLQLELDAINAAIEELAVDTERVRTRDRANINNLIGQIKTQKEALSAQATIAASTSSSDEESVEAFRAMQVIIEGIEDLKKSLDDLYTKWLNKGEVVIVGAVELISEE